MRNPLGDYKILLSTFTYEEQVNELNHKINELAHKKNNTETLWILDMIE